MGTTAEKLQKILDTKNAIKQSIINKGGNIDDNTVFSEYASAIESISSGGGSHEDEDGLIDGTLTTYTNDRITSIRTYAFYYCSNLSSASFANVTQLGGYAFSNCSKLTSIDLPRVTSIGAYAFSNCSKLTSIDLPRVTSIGAYAFSNCSNLSSVNIPALITAENDMFYECGKLISVDFPVLTKIKSNSFYFCYNLRSVNIPLVTSIGEWAFGFCYLLTKIIIRTTSQVCTLNSNVFYNCYHILGTTNATYNPQGLKDGYIYVPDELVESYKIATNWVKYADQIKPLSELPTEE